MIIYVAIIINSHTCLLQTDFEIKSRTQIFTIIQFCYQIKTIFPNSIVKTYIMVRASYSAIKFSPFNILFPKEVSGKQHRKLTPNAGPS